MKNIQAEIMVNKLTPDIIYGLRRPQADVSKKISSKIRDIPISNWIPH